MATSRGAAPDRQPDVAHPVMAVDVLGGGQVLDQRHGCSGVDRHRFPAQLDDVESVLDRLVEAHVACDHRDGRHLDLPVAERHHQGYSVVGGRVGVDDQAAGADRYRKIIPTA